MSFFLRFMALTLPTLKKLNMYSRFVKILKFIQIIGYLGVLIIAGIYSKLIFASYLFFLFGIYNGVNTIAFLICVIFFCLVYYIRTQTIIVVIDLLNRIEINTRNSSRS